MESIETKFLSHFNAPDEQQSYTAETGQVLTFGSGAKIDTARSKFGGSALYLDGTANGYITIPDSDDWYFANGDFTVDFWINWDMGVTSNGFLWGQVVDGNNRGIDFGLEPNTPYIYAVVGGVAKCDYHMSLTPTANTWYHYEICRTGDTIKFFVNGVAQTMTNSTAIPAGYTFPNHSTTFNIGKATNGSHGYPKCWIDEFRISKGIARHTANFPVPTVPYEVSAIKKIIGLVGTDIKKIAGLPNVTPELYTTPLFNDANLQGYWRLGQDLDLKLLLHFDGADAATSTVDSANSKAVTFVGNAQLDTAAYKFGSSSLLLDGTGDYVTLADTDDWTFGAGDFTVDMWVKRNATNANHYLIGQADAGGTQRSWEIFIIANDNVVGGRFWYDASNFITAQTTATITNDGLFHHVALVRHANTLKIYVDGVAGSIVGDVTGRTNVNSTAALAIGNLGVLAGAYQHNGWIDEVRIVKGVAKWTSDFTPPAAAYLCAGDDFSANGYHLAPGVIPTYVAGKFGYGADFEFDNSQYLTIAGGSCGNLNITGSQTWGCWIKPESLTTTHVIMGKADSTPTVYNHLAVQSAGNANFRLNGLSTDITSDNVTVVVGRWHFIVGRWDSATGTLDIFVNGLKKTTTGVTGSVTSNANAFSIGRMGARNLNYTDGIVDDCFIFNRALTDAEISWLFQTNIKVLGKSLNIV